VTVASGTRGPFLAQVTNGCIIATGDTVITQDELDQIRAIVADTLDALGVEPEPDPSAVLSQRFLERDKTTAWARDFDTEEELAAWLRFHRVTKRSLENALREYGIYKRTGTPKRFEVHASSRRRFVLVRGNRRWRIAGEDRKKREEAKGEQ
jgi:hypothetical protein